ncbi:WG repeat-containing protein [Chitinophaga rhizosphaerae]|uniref:WG repeat-containing protein n=1 Tax=Chitinophaga rhizosphaerae TaxID=1864947 RepID=UPI000F7FC5C3|nr:WG repeat-containing protein [Chitinophaga rhizosphaerae]
MIPKNIIRYIFPGLLLTTCDVGAQQYQYIGEVNIRIADGAPTNLTPSVKFYAGDRVMIQIDPQSQVRHNPWEERHEDCDFLFIGCDDVITPHHNYKSARDLPITTYLRGDNGRYLDPHGTLVFAAPTEHFISLQEDFGKAFDLVGFFGDYRAPEYPDGIPIDRAVSDGAYKVKVYLDASIRIQRFAQKLEESKENVTLQSIFAENMLNSNLRQFYPAKVAKIIGDHCIRYPNIEGIERRSILTEALRLDPTNPDLIATMADTYLKAGDLSGAELNYRKLIADEKSGGANPRVLGTAYMGLGNVNYTRGKSILTDRIEAAASAFGQAAIYFMAANDYTAVAEAYLLEAKCFQLGNTPAHLEAALAVMKKAFALETETMVITKGNKTGLVDMFGQVIVAPQYENIRVGRTALMAAQKGTKWGFVNKLGEEVTQFIYDDAWPFSNNIARVRHGDNFFYIDPTGKALFGERYKWATQFEGWLAAVETLDGQFYYMNNRGERFANISRNFIASQVGQLGAGGLAAVPNPGNSLENTLINNPGAESNILSQFMIAFAKNDPIAARSIIAFNKDNEPTWRRTLQPGNYGFIDDLGTIRKAPDGNIYNVQYTPFGYDLGIRFPGRVGFAHLDSTLQLVNFRVPEVGNWLIRVLRNGHYTYMMDNAPGKWGYFNKDAERRMPPIYDMIEGIEYTSLIYTIKDQEIGLCDAADGKRIKTFIQNKTGIESIIILPFWDFDGTGAVGFPVPRQLKVVMPQGTGITDMQGNQIVDLLYNDIAPVSNSQKRYIVTDKQDRQGVLQAGDTWLIPLADRKLFYSIANQTYTSIENDRIGIWDETGKEIFKPQFEHINYLSDTMFAGLIGEDWRLFTTTGRTLQLNAKAIYPVVVDPALEKNRSKGLVYMAFAEPYLSILTRRLLDRPTDLVIYKNPRNKFGVWNAKLQTELIAPLYDTIFATDQFFIGLNEIDDEHLEFQLITFSGTPLIPGIFLEFTYSPESNLVLGIRKTGEAICVDANTGKPRITAKVNFKGLLQDAIRKNTAKWENIMVYQNDLPRGIPGSFKRVVETGKMIYLIGNGDMIQIDPSSGYFQEIAAENITSHSRSN